VGGNIVTSRRSGTVGHSLSNGLDKLVGWQKWIPETTAGLGGFCSGTALTRIEMNAATYPLQSSPGNENSIGHSANCRRTLNGGSPRDSQRTSSQSQASSIKGAIWPGSDRCDCWIGREERALKISHQSRASRRRRSGVRCYPHPTIRTSGLAPTRSVAPTKWTGDPLVSMSWTDEKTNHPFALSV
jgi:hypothetical protein